MTGKSKFTATKLAVDDFTSGSITTHASCVQIQQVLLSPTHCFSDIKACVSWPWDAQPPWMGVACPARPNMLYHPADNCHCASSNQAVQPYIMYSYATYHWPLHRWRSWIHLHIGIHLHSIAWCYGHSPLVPNTYDVPQMANLHTAVTIMNLETY